jgi:hypothetical protein
MSSSLNITEIISKHHQEIPLDQIESDLLKEWLQESDENVTLLKDLDNDVAGSEQKIFNKINQPTDLQDDGSASAFENTENMKEYEKDMSDEELDQLLSE